MNRVCFGIVLLALAILAAALSARAERLGRVVTHLCALCAIGLLIGIVPELVIGRPLRFLSGQLRKRGAGGADHAPSMRNGKSSGSHGRLQFSLRTILLVLLACGPIFAAARWIAAWQPIAVAIVGAVVGGRIGQKRGGRGLRGAVIGFGLLLAMYPISLGPVAVCAWDGLLGPIKRPVLEFYYPLLERRSHEPLHAAYEWYLCQWLNVDVGSLRDWVFHEVEQ